MLQAGKSSGGSPGPASILYFQGWSQAPGRLRNHIPYQEQVSEVWILLDILMPQPPPALSEESEHNQVEGTLQQWGSFKGVCVEQQWWDSISECKLHHNGQAHSLDRKGSWAQSRAGTAPRPHNQLVGALRLILPTLAPRSWWPPLDHIDALHTLLLKPREDLQGPLGLPQTALPAIHDSRGLCGGI